MSNHAIEIADAQFEMKHSFSVITDHQRAMLPELVALAMVGYGLLKNDKSASEWTHPAIAAFRADVEPELNRRAAIAREEAEWKWGDA